METECCSADVAILPDVDVPVAYATIQHLLDEIDTIHIPLVVWDLLDDRVVASDVSSQTVSAMALHAHKVWMVQRAGCFGLLTRLVFTDALGRARWCVGAKRPAGASEPLAWRIALAMALSRVVADEAPVRAAG